MSSLFEYAVIYHPKKKKDEEVAPSELIIAPKFVLARTEKEVTMKATREIPEQYVDKLDSVEICVRPF